MAKTGVCHSITLNKNKQIESEQGENIKKSQNHDLHRIWPNYKLLELHKNLLQRVRVKAHRIIELILYAIRLNLFFSW